MLDSTNNFFSSDVIGDPDNAQNEVPGSVANKMHPQYKRESEAMACGRMASLAAKTTETADVVAGTEVGFHIQHEFDGSNVCYFPYNSCPSKLLYCYVKDVYERVGTLTNINRLDSVGSSIRVLRKVGWLEHRMTTSPTSMGRMGIGLRLLRSSLR